MKKKRILFHALALVATLGAATSLSSCVETDEPESITQLRQAKAEEVKAEAEKTQAEATKEAAEAKVKEAQAASETAKAKEQELLNALQELQNAKEQAQYEADKATAEVNTKLQLEQLNQQYEMSVAQKKQELAKLELTTNVELAKLQTNGVNDELKVALNNWTRKQKDVADAQKELSDAIAKSSKEEDFQADIDTKQSILKQKQKNKEDFEETVKSNDYATIAAKYEEYKEQENSANTKRSLIQIEMNTLWSAYENICNSIDDGTAYANERIYVEVESPNEDLNALIEQKGNIGNFVYDAANKKFVARTPIARGNIKNETIDLRTAFAAYVDPLKHNSEAYTNKINELNDKTLTELTEKVKDLKETWENAVDAFLSNTSATKLSKLQEDLENATLELFGEYTESDSNGDGKIEAGEYSYHLNYGLTVAELCNKDIFDNVVEYAIQKGASESDVLDNGTLGYYGRMKLLEISKLQKDVNFTAYESAKAAIEIIDAMVEDYETTKKQKETEKALAENSAEVKNAYNAYQEKYQEYRSVDSEYSNASTMRNSLEYAFYYYESNSDNYLRPNNYNEVSSVIIEFFDKQIADAQKQLEKAQKQLEDFQAGNYDQDDAIVAAQENLAVAEEAAKEAEEEYNLLKAAYGTSSK